MTYRSYLYNKQMPLIIFIASFIVYILTLSNTIYGGDAGDLVSAILANGFAHPPGYPLYTVLGLVLKNLPLTLTPAGKVTLISSISTAASMVVLYLLIGVVEKKHFQKPVGIIVCLVLLFNYLIWLYAVVPEVFALNSIITLSLLYFSVLLYQTKHRRYLYLNALILGLGLSHHHTILLSIPTVLYLLWKTQQEKNILDLKSLGKGTLFFLIGLIPYLYAIGISKTLPEVFWGDMSSVKGFFFVVLRQGYGTFQAGTFVTQNYLHRLIQLKNLFLFVLSDFSVAGVLFILIGVVQFVRTSYIPTCLKIALFLSLFFYGPFFFFYANFPLYDTFEFATVERFLIIFYFLLGIPLYFGIKAVMGFLLKVLSRFSNLPIKFITFIILITFVVFPLSFALKNLPFIYALHDDQTAEKLGKDILDHTPKGSIILLGGDTTLFNTQYVYYANKTIYKDTIIIHASKLTLEFYARALKKHYPSLVIKKPDDFSMSALISDNKKNFLIYSNYKYPLKDTQLEWRPQGLLFKLVNKNDEPSHSLREMDNFWQHSYHHDLSQEINKYPYKWKNFFVSDVLAIYETAHLNSAYYYLSNQELLQARYHLLEAHTLRPSDTDYYYLLSAYYLKSNDCKAAEDSIQTALEEKQDSLYIDRLKEVGECYTKDADKKRVQKKLDALRKQQTKSLREL